MTAREDRFNDDVERLAAVQCLKNAHGHIATAYSQIDGALDTPGRRSRMVRETLDAVDWIRRGLEHLAQSLEDGIERKLAEKCASFGLPPNFDTLMRHMENNHAATVGAQKDHIASLERELEGAVSLTREQWERVLWWLHQPVPPGPAKALDEAIIREISSQRR